MRINLLICICLLFSSWAHSCDTAKTKAALAKLQWITEDYPPYNFKNKQGQLEGIFTDVLLLVYQALGINKTRDDIKILPWSQLYYTMKNDTGYGAFSMVKTSTRADHFSFVPMPLITQFSIMTLAKNKQKVIEKLDKNISIAVVKGDIGHLLLVQQNVIAKQVETSSGIKMISMLLAEEVDAIAYSQDVALFQSNQLGLSPDSIVAIETLDDTMLSNFVFHKDAPTCMTTLFSDTVNKLQRNGQLAAVWKRYLSQ